MLLNNRNNFLVVELNAQKIPRESNLHVIVDCKHKNYLEVNIDTKLFSFDS